MKTQTLLVFLIAFFSFTFCAQASFPVKRATTNNLTIEQSVEEEKTPISPAAAADGKSQIVATLICFLVGWIGIHRFYLGYTWQGVVQLLTLGGLGVWALIDLIRIILGDLGPKNGSYSKTF
jgi:TM2 domain-containing membrane protein YozV